MGPPIRVADFRSSRVGRTSGAAPPPPRVSGPRLPIGMDSTVALLEKLRMKKGLSFRRLLVSAHGFSSSSNSNKIHPSSYAADSIASHCPTPIVISNAGVPPVSAVSASARGNGRRSRAGFIQPFRRGDPFVVQAVFSCAPFREGGAQNSSMKTAKNSSKNSLNCVDATT